MSDTVRYWLENAYKAEIAESKEAIKNEKVWKRGSLDSEERKMHTQNIRDYQEYISVLKEKLKEIN